MKTTTNTDKTAARLAIALPLHDDETLLWYQQTTDGDYELRVRTADGFESIHDVSADQLDALS